ncbi:MAG: hypothetical protein IT290_02935, partial [Deltaproteobacteria bacterium]|nr:hypothetical protein [Deltaproteobacteria bacterium]
MQETREPSPSLLQLLTSVVTAAGAVSACALLIVAIAPLMIDDAAAATKRSKPVRAVRGEYIVKFRDGSTATTRAKARRSLGVTFSRSLDSIGAQIVETRDDTEFNDSFAKQLLSEGKVEYVEPNYIVEALATPNDARFGDLWGLHNTGQSGGTENVDIDAPEAWELGTGSTDI